ncbi:hypothetical protein CMV_011956 [Castanea mollissima]|uniref:Protein kinase domain-containing protein n=1 Tax=Castanea mollissima TaxID=60419 RepID=A0A8J4R0Y6_9ROSI|nr:hypothetical protein CMV_011956 [Castanea mollissima]
MMEPLVSRYSLWLLFLIILAISLVPSPVRSGDAEALLSLKSTIDTSNVLQWQQQQQQQHSNVCNWTGVKECMKGRVTKLVLEYLNLTGTLDPKPLNQLDQLRVLSLKGNSLSAQIPDLSGLLNLKSLFLNFNNFSGDFPDSISNLHRLKVVVLSGNQISGQIPTSLLRLRRLYTLYLQDNNLTGSLPPFNQTSLRFFNVSNNNLSGEIPLTPALVRFNTSSFSGNVNLCGEQIKNVTNDFCQSQGPAGTPPSPLNKTASSKKCTKLIKIIGGSVGGFVVLLICLVVLLMMCGKNRTKPEEITGNKALEAVAVRGEGTSSGGRGGNNGDKPGGFSWECEGLGSLVFCGAGDHQMSYSLEDLLKASAETLGRGIMGCTYKAVMESGFIVTVKRLKDARYPRLDEFRRHMEVLGRLSHPNLVPLRAYFQAKEERLLVYDYFPNGSLFSLIHGSRASGGGKPLHWTSCLKIAEDLATDYGLLSFRDPDSLEEPSATSLFYRAPECRDIRKPSTQQADVYSFGVLVLELLTGKTPFQDLVLEHGSDIPRWVRSVREEETESGDEPASGSGNETSEEKLQALLNVAMACVSIAPESRPTMREVLKMIRDARAEAQISSNSSDHSPGRWSDTVQSLPREEHLSI